ncbi:cytochrome P450 6k1-like, partial [Temnothorax longispinosus]|uniref:cytochrome P450 6k1-like n=1 Tax=Temnothorax longispinosus TaxID=300112 RepID=UPI003A99220E
MAFITEYWSLDGTIISTILIIIAYFYMTRNFKYWKKRGVLQIPPTLIFGNFIKCLILKKAPSYFLKELYERAKDEPYIGFYIFNKPFLLLRDRKVIQHVFTADSNFGNRYSSADPKDRIGYANLFFMEDPPQFKWRMNLTRFFLNDHTQKNMFGLMLECGKHLDEYLDSLELDSNGQLIDMMDVSSKFTTDVIWSIAFGLDVNTFQNPNSDYSRHIKMMLENNEMRTWKMLAMFFLPNLIRSRKRKVFGEETIVFLRKIFWETMTKRLESGEKRYDLIDTLVEIKWNVSGSKYIEDRFSKRNNYVY